MAAAKGRDFLLKIGSAGSAVTLAAMTTTSFTVNAETVDVTNKDSVNRAREYLAGAGVVSMSISASGILTGGAQFGTLLTNLKAGSNDTYTIVFDNADTIVGPFAVTSLEASGEFNGQQTYSVSLESAGDFTFTQTP
jgi:TP901-1 family phage major tail protein